MNIEKKLFKAIASQNISKIQAVYSLIYNEYKGLLFYVALQYVKSMYDAEDIVSDTFIEFFNKSSSINSSIKSYLTVICKNKALDYIKKNKPVTYLDNDTLSLLSNKIETITFVSDDLNQLLVKMSKHISNEDIKIIILHLINDFTFSEVALKLETNEKTIKTRYYRALKKLKKEGIA